MEGLIFMNLHEKENHLIKEMLDIADEIEKDLTNYKPEFFQKLHDIAVEIKTLRNSVEYKAEESTNH